MASQALKTGLATLAMALLASCASTPPNVQPLSISTDPSSAIAQTDEMISSGRDRQLDVLSPKNFKRAEKALAEAKEKRASNASNEKVLKEVSYARAWLKEAQDKGEVARASMKEISDARAAAWRAGAEKNFPKDWQRLENDTKDVTHSIEKGDLGPANRNKDKLVQRYRDMEVQSVTVNTLGKAETNLKNAQKIGAKKFAPKTLERVERKYEAAKNLIRQNPKNSAMIDKLADEVTRESAYLISVTERSRTADNTSVEDLVLREDRQKRTIAGLRNEFEETSTQVEQLSKEKQEALQKQQELEQKQALIDKANKVRSQFSPNEADVYTQGNKVMIRLKGIQFATNQARITPRGARLLDKVEEAVNEFADAKITVEGHTDTVGSRKANMVVSEKRAKAVQNYLVSEGSIDPDRIEAVGMGYENPVSDNKTPQGRAQNRRIDVIIQTE